MAETAAPRYAPEDPSLPKPWKGLVDGSTGFLYFWNPETNVTTYDRPKTSSGRGPSPVPTKSVATPISSSVHVHHSSQGHHRSGRAEEDGRYNGEMNSRPKLAAIPSGRNYQVGQVLSVDTVGTDSAAVFIHGGIKLPPSFQGEFRSKNILLFCVDVVKLRVSSVALSMEQYLLLVSKGSVSYMLMMLRRWKEDVFGHVLGVKSTFACAVCIYASMANNIKLRRGCT